MRALTPVTLCIASVALLSLIRIWQYSSQALLYPYGSGESQLDPEGLGHGRRSAYPDNQAIAMSYAPPPRSGISTRGQAMNVSQSMARRLGMPPAEFKVLTPESVKDFVFVTACSANHFNESRGAVASVQRHYPGRRLLYYDIGLRDEQRREVESWCDVTLRRFDFERYPDHVRLRAGKHFKPIVVMDALFQYGGVVWLDASIRFRGGEIVQAYPNLVQNGGFYTFLDSVFWTYVFLHPNTCARLTTDLERQKTSHNFISSVFVMHNTKEVYWNIAHWWFLCALDPDCIPPPRRITARGKVNCSDFQKYNLAEGGTGRAPCHSFDQASLNVLASNYYGFQKQEYNPVGRIVDMIRSATRKFSLRLC